MHNSDLFCRKLSLIGGLFLIVLPVLLSGCSDVMGGSIYDLIAFSTDTARIVDVSIASLPKEKIVKTSDAWLVDPDETKVSGIIQLNVKIDNPQQYDLAVTPVITEFIGDDWKRVSSPPNRPISVSFVSGTTDTVIITIGDTSPGHRVRQGDSFRIRLDLAMKDGTRVFDSYTKIPQIICDSPLKSAWNVEFYPYDENLDEYKIGGYYGYVSWKIQSDAVHVGINYIAVTFKSQATESGGGYWEFKREYVSGDGPEGATNWTCLTDPSLSLGENFTFPFPRIKDLIIIDGVAMGYDYIVTVRDKNDLSAKNDGGVSPETELENIILSYYYREDPDVPKPSPWTFEKKNKISYNITVPFSVEKIRFTVTKSNYDGIVQEVLWAGDTTELSTTQLVYPAVTLDPTKDEDKKIVEIRIRGKYSDEEPRELTYTFKITRLEPNRDSTLKGLYIQTSPGGPLISPVGDFQDIPYLHDAGYTKPVTLNYTFYAPPTATSVRLLADYLSTQVIKNESNIKANLGTPYIEARTENLFNENDYDYSKEDYVTIPELYVVRNGWEYNLTVPQQYYYQIKVSPQDDDSNETKTKNYFITVIKPDQDGNPDARLENITVKTSGGDTLLAPGWDANSFDSALLNYTVYVPSSVPFVTLEADALKAAGSYVAEIRGVTSVSIDGAGDIINTSTPSGSISLSGANGINLGDGAKKRVTLSVYSKDGNSTSKDYTVTLIKCHSSDISNVQLEGGNGNLRVSWDNSDAGYTNEVWYSYYNNDPAKDIPEKALKVLKDGFVSGSLIEGLFNNRKYNVWVRSVNTTTNSVGDWKKAETLHPPSGPAWPYGIPGAAELNRFKITPDSGSIYYIDTSPNEDTYNLILPWSTGSVTVAGEAPAGVSFATQASFIRTGAIQLPEGAPTETTVFTVESPDERTARDYKIKVFRRLQAPSIVTAQPWDKAVKLEWVASSIADVSYDVEVYSSDPSISPAPNPVSTLNGISGSGVTVASLTNRQTYYFRVRGVKDGVPGEWSAISQAQPRSTVNVLSKITIDPDPDVFAPSFSPDITAYIIILNADSGLVTITGDRVLGENQTIRYSENDEKKVNPQAGKKEVKTITVIPDNTAVGVSKEYTVTAYKRPKTPASLALTAQDRSINAVWTAAADAGAAYYEIYYATESATDPTSLPANVTKLPQDVIHSGTSMNAAITGLTNGTTYYIWIRAVSADGIDGKFTSWATANPDVGTPVITVNFPDLGDYSYNLTNEASEILFWDEDSPLTVKITRSGTGTSCMWYIDNVPLTFGELNTSETEYSLSVSARQFSVATHSITARITLDGQVFSKTVEFEVKSKPAGP